MTFIPVESIFLVSEHIPRQLDLMLRGPSGENVRFFILTQWYILLLQAGLAFHVDDLLK